MARQADGSTDTLELDFEQVCQSTTPQVTQLWYKKLDNIWLQLWDVCSIWSLMQGEDMRTPESLVYTPCKSSQLDKKTSVAQVS